MINYKYISEAIDFYVKCRFEYLEVPWFCSLQALDFTKPPEKRTCESFVGHLVGSGEQSFIELWLRGKLPQGRYVCATPCFRDEDILDNFHRNYFFKVELIFSEPDNPCLRLS